MKLTVAVPMQVMAYIPAIYRNKFNDIGLDARFPWVIDFGESIFVMVIHYPKCSPRTHFYVKFDACFIVTKSEIFLCFDHPRVMNHLCTINFSPITDFKFSIFVYDARIFNINSTSSFTQIMESPYGGIQSIIVEFILKD